MKRHTYLIFCIITSAWWLSMPCQAKDTPAINNYNFGYVSIGTGYTSLCQDVPGSKIQGGAAFLGGLGYEFRHNSFWLSVGAQYLMEQSTLKADRYATPYYDGEDDMGKAVRFQYLVEQTDKHTFNTIDIPLMAGYYYSGFYVGAGAKVGFSSGSSIQTTGSYRLTGTYDNGDGTYKDVIVLGRDGYDIGYYRTYPNEQKIAYTLRPEIAIIGEVGYDILSTIMNNRSTCHLLKIGFYFECGVSNIRPKDSMEALTINTKDVTIATINPYVLSNKTVNQRITPFMVGIKLTYLIGGSRNSTGTWHRGCQCYGN